MKKIMKAFMLIIMTSILIVVVNVIESQKKTPLERYQWRKEQEVDGVQANGGKNIIIQDYPGMVQYELLSYEIIEDFDIQKQDTYEASYFEGGELPDPFYTIKETDYAAVREEAPEFDEFLKNFTKYSEQEGAEIYKRTQGIIDKHTKVFHPKTMYLFIKCRMTNLEDREWTGHLNLEIIVTSADEKDYNIQYNPCYFDQTQEVNSAGEPCYTNWYTFKPEETVECTIGFAIRSYYGEGERYYIGCFPSGTDTIEFSDINEYFIEVMEIGE